MMKRILLMLSRPILFADLFISALQKICISFMIKFYREPVFRAKCSEVGKNLKIEHPYVYGKTGHYDIRIGNDVKISGTPTLLMNHRNFPMPRLEIGDGTYVGGAVFNVRKSIKIGKNCYINGKMLDSDGHPMDKTRRRNKDPISNNEIKPIVIGDDVWIGYDSIILKGVTIGSGTIIAAGSIVTHNMPKDCIVAGNPAKKICSISDYKKRRK